MQHANIWGDFFTRATTFDTDAQNILEAKWLKKRVQIRHTNGIRETGMITLCSAIEQRVIVRLDVANRDGDLLISVPIDKLQHATRRYHSLSPLPRFVEQVREWWRAVVRVGRA